MVVLGGGAVSYERGTPAPRLSLKWRRGYISPQRGHRQVLGRYGRAYEPIRCSRDTNTVARGSIVVLPTETNVESGTSQSKSGTSVNLSNSGLSTRELTETRELVNPLVLN